jgi:hypothetical protein
MIPATGSEDLTTNIEDDVVLAAQTLGRAPAAYPAAKERIEDA